MAYTPTALMARMPGTRIQLGSASMRVNRPIIGMFMMSSSTLHTAMEAISPHTSPGCWVNSAGPGVML